MPYEAGTATGNNISALWLNQELQKIETALQEYLSRIATDSNSMEEALDMNGHEIVNVLTDPENPLSLATVEYVQSVLGTGVDVGALASAVATVQGNIVVLSDMLTITDNIATQNQTDLVTLNTDFAQAQTNITNLQNSVTSLTTALGVVQSLAATNEADIVTINAALSSLQTSLTSLTATVADNQANIAKIATHEKGFSFQDSLPDSTEVAKYVFTKPHILRATAGSTATGANRGNTSVPATTGNADFEILQNGTVIGTILFGANLTTATFNIPTDITFGAGTQLIIRTGTQLELESPSITLQLEEQL